MRHPLHSLCPYFAMFPEDFVAKQVLAYTQRGEWVFDPFSGRGTTVFESLLNGRPAAGTDVNPVAACVAGAKANPPDLRNVLKRLDFLESEFKLGHARTDAIGLPIFFRWCFHERTLDELLFLRRELKWKTSKVDRFIAAVALGCLHGESHKTPNCLSKWDAHRGSHRRHARSEGGSRRRAFGVAQRRADRVSREACSQRFDDGDPEPSDQRVPSRYFKGAVRARLCLQSDRLMICVRCRSASSLCHRYRQSVP